ncbi:MAG TPA: cytochrome P460 family protein [Chthoniobacterales bacterium]|nr:cytochrome P460 family protein [Chthoniobacterales bacterium]
MKNLSVLTSVAACMAFLTMILWPNAQAQPLEGANTPMTASSATETAKPESAPIFVTEIPAGYRDWKLISVAREEGKLDDIRAVLGNNTALKAYRAGQLPFPDGAIIARLAWSYLPSEENNKVFGHPQSFVAGTPKNGLQFMVKDSKKYAATGGWGFAQFDNGKPAGEAVMKNCFSCHESVKSRDFVFTKYTP